MLRDCTRCQYLTVYFHMLLFRLLDYLLTSAAQSNKSSVTDSQLLWATTLFLHYHPAFPAPAHRTQHMLPREAPAALCVCQPL
jgi:hypothetical protein